MRDCHNPLRHALRALMLLSPKQGAFMEREWAELWATISRIGSSWKDSTRLTYTSALIVRVHLWSVIHNRPTGRACDPRHWDWRTRPKQLPDQSTNEPAHAPKRRQAVPRIFRKRRSRLVAQARPAIMGASDLAGAPMGLWKTADQYSQNPAAARLTCIMFASRGLLTFAAPRLSINVARAIEIIEDFRWWHTSSAHV